MRRSARGRLLAGWATIESRSTDGISANGHRGDEFSPRPRAGAAIASPPVCQSPGLSKSDSIHYQVGGCHDTPIGWGAVTGLRAGGGAAHRLWTTPTDGGAR